MSRPSFHFLFHELRLTMNSILALSLLNILNSTIIPQEGWWILSYLGQYLPPFTLAPRFILSLRALYVRDLQGRYESDIDTAFGLSMGSVQGAAASTIMFTHSGENEREDQREEIQLVERNSEIRGAGSNV